MDNFDTELVVMGIKLALTQYQLPIDPDEVECFDEFHDRYGKYIKAANGAWYKKDGFFWIRPFFQNNNGWHIY